MKLYYSPGACSLASHIALIEAEAEFAAIAVDLKTHRTERGQDFYAISPRGYVPALETERNGLISENIAVLAYLDDRLGTAPEGFDRFRLLEWLSYIGTEIHAAFHPLFAGAAGAARKEAKEKAAARYVLAAKLLSGSDWLLGDAPGVADNYLFATTRWAKAQRVALPAEIEAMHDRNLERESVQKALEAEGLG